MQWLALAALRTEMIFLSHWNGMSKSECNHCYIFQWEWTIVHWPILCSYIVEVLEAVHCVMPHEFNPNASNSSSISFIDLLRLPQVTLDNNLLSSNMAFQTPAEHDSSITSSPVYDTKNVSRTDQSIRTHAILHKHWLLYQNHLPTPKTIPGRQ